MLFSPTTAYPVIRKIPEGELALLADSVLISMWLARCLLWLPPVWDLTREQVAKRISRRTISPLWFVLAFPLS